MDQKLLKSKMTLFGDNQRKLSKSLNLSEQLLSLKISGKAKFNQDEIKLIKDKYNLSDKEVVLIFFN